jgi:hypothetical protein
MTSIAHWKRRLNDRLPHEPTLPEALANAPIEADCRQLCYTWRSSFWSPATTLLTFLLQVHSAEKTLRAAVAALLTQRAATGATEAPSPDPSAYCQARQRRSVAVVQRVLRRIAEQIQPRSETAGAWLGRRVWIVDGTTVSMPDEPELSALSRPSLVGGFTV